MPTPDDNQQQQQQPPQALEYEAWIKDQPAEVKAALEGHTKGLKSALDSERETRKGLEKQVRDLASAAEKGSEAQNQLTKLADQMSAADRKATFYEQAHAAGVSNLKLAFMAATTDDLFDKKGEVDFAAMKKNYPELFAAEKPKGKADAGAGTGPKSDGTDGHQAMNDFIRMAAGRNT